MEKASIPGWSARPYMVRAKLPKSQSSDPAKVPRQCRKAQRCYWTCWQIQLGSELQAGSGSAKLPAMSRQTDGWETYVRRNRTLRRPWDRLPAERLMATERAYYSNAWGNAQDKGKGRRVMCKGSTCGAPDGVKSPGKMKHRPGEPVALKDARRVREGAVGNVPQGNALAAYFMISRAFPS